MTRRVTPRTVKLSKVQLRTARIDKTNVGQNQQQPAQNERPIGPRGRDPWSRGEVSPQERQKRALIVRLCRVMHQAGAAAHRVEDGAHVAARALGSAVTVFSAPTVLIVAFAPDDTYTLRVSPKDVHLDQLAAVDHIVDSIESGALNADEAHAAFDELHGRAPPYRLSVTLAAHALVAAAVATGFGASAPAAILAAVIGVVGGIVERALLHRPHAKRAMYLALAGGASFAASALSATMGTTTDAVIIAGLIALFPGFTLTIAVAELATGNLSAGTSRFTAAVLVLMQMALGAALARGAALRVWGDAAFVEHGAGAMSLWVEAGAMAFGTLALSVIMHAPARLLLSAVFTAALAFVGVKLSSPLVGPEMAALVGAFVATVTSTLLGRWQHVPAVVSQVPAIVLLVPGAVGYRGAVALVMKHTSEGLETAVSMLVIAVTIVAGMVLANAAVSPRRSF